MIQIIKYDGSSVTKDLCPSEKDKETEKTVEEIIKNVRENGDTALFNYCRQFDGFSPQVLEVAEEELQTAFSAIEPQFIEVLKTSAANIEDFHKRQIRNGFIINERKGIVTGQKVVPLDRVGLYIPGGTASYPSSVLMNAIPAKLAGVKEVIMVTPAKGGTISPEVLAAAKLAGVDKVFKIGGAQAVAALAYGTETVPKVDKIVGPGNAFVAEAKKQVFGLVDIDMIAGPSEILILADETCSPAFVAADLLSQAEHDILASAVLVTDSLEFAKEVSKQLEAQIPLLPRADIARASIDENGRIIIVTDMVQGVEIANSIAPEHLEICLDNPFDYLDGIRHAGSVFLGKNCPEALGDYFAGPNHTLPTSGTARFSSPLSVDDFVKKYQYTYYTKEALKSVYKDVALFAEKEGLCAHAKSVTIRFEENNAD